MPQDGQDAQDESKQGVAAWLRRWWPAMLAELVSTSLLMLLGIAATLPVGGTHPPLAYPALTFGIIVLINVEVFGPVSGAHMNPAVTLAAVLDRRLGAVPAVGYVLAQVLGAVLGVAALMGLAPAHFPPGAVTGGTAPAAGVSALAALAVEALLTGTLVLLCCAGWAARDASGPDRTVATKLGLAVAGLTFSGGALTGAGFNPARSFAPDLLQSFNAHHWVYWAGPLGGAALGALLHRALRPPPAPPRPAEGLPLHKPGP